MNKFSLSSNIENGFPDGFRYLVTPNASKAISSILSYYETGVHSFTIIGAYGTGKSSFLLAFESDLLKKNKKPLLFSSKVFLKSSKVRILKFIGDYADLSLVFARNFNVDENQNVLDSLKDYYEECERNNEFLVIIIDEFGKIIEHAAKNDPEREFYFLQKFSEFVNNTSRNILLLTTLHQNFGAYAKHLTEEQRFEWAKIKGRFLEIAFVEPIEQLLTLAANQQSQNSYCETTFNLKELINLAKNTHFLSDDFSDNVAYNLFPMDPFSAFIIASAIQRYGQNERSLFSFLSAKGRNSISKFTPNSTLSYNLLKVYDYISYYYFSQINDINADSMSWRAIRVSIERVESQEWSSLDELRVAIDLVKVIGLLNLFCNAGFKFNSNALSKYAKLAMSIEDASKIIKKLEQRKIIRYASYKERLVLFEGTDVDIEAEVINARLVVPHTSNFIDELRMFFSKKITPVKANYYQKGTPRYFDYIVSEEPVEIVPQGDIDGYIELIFSTQKNAISKVINFSKNSKNAIVFAYFKNSNDIENNLYNISIYRYINEHIDDGDRVAKSEINKLIEHEEQLLDATINTNLFSFNGSVVWIFDGVERQISSHREFNVLLSHVCESIYPKTPVMNNELFNRHKLSASISTAKSKYFKALLENGDEYDLGFDNSKYPPEKTIYFSLLKNTGLHVDGTFTEDPSKDIKPLWDVCENFLNSTKNKPRKLSDLVNILSNSPFKIKDGFLEFWIPTYLYIRRGDFSLFGKQDQFVPSFSLELLDIMKKNIGDFKVKALDVDGIKMKLFNQYRKFLNINESNVVDSQSFIETIKPFLFFYNKQLNDYAKHTKKLSHIETVKFRDVLASAKDPEKSFLEDLPRALGYTEEKLHNEQYVQDYCCAIQRAVKELRCCYEQLIDRLENTLIDKLGLCSCDYENYIQEIKQRLSIVKPNLLPPRQREFYQHAISSYDNRIEWYQSICFSVLGSPLDKLRDSQESQLHDDLIYLFRECEQVGVLSESINYKIDEKEIRESMILEGKINDILSGDKNLDVYTLMRMLQKRINYE